ncbi:MAG: transketolase [Methanomassiliicoccales archaeon]|nr:transketolase [Methanomassiliicoccales archaeon]
MRSGESARIHLTNIKRNIIRMVNRSGTSHVGSCLSAADILYTLYFRSMKIDPANPKDPNRDFFILSKAHSSVALYSTLAERGFFPPAWLETYSQNEGRLTGHLERDQVPGVETSGGSLGMGLSLGLGVSIGKKLHGNGGRVFVLLSDGECEEGSIWEAVMLASTLKTDNLVAIVDMNGWQACGRTNVIVEQKNFAERWKAFNWHVTQVDGHDCDALESAFKERTDGPHVVLARTVKGKGVSFMEDRLEWHYKVPNDKEMEIALKELGGDQE